MTQIRRLLRMAWSMVMSTTAIVRGFQRIRFRIPISLESLFRAYFLAKNKTGSLLNSSCNMETNLLLYKMAIKIRRNLTTPEIILVTLNSLFEDKTKFKNIKAITRKRTHDQKNGIPKSVWVKLDKGFFVNQGNGKFKIYSVTE